MSPNERLSELNIGSHLMEELMAPDFQCSQDIIYYKKNAEGVKQEHSACCKITVINMMNNFI